MDQWGCNMEQISSSWEDILTDDEREGGPSPNGNSWWKLFETCPYAFYIQHVRRMKMTPNHPRYDKLRKALEIGGLYHEALARYYNAHLKYFNNRGEKIVEAPQKEVDNACTDAMFDIINRAGEVVPGTAAEVRRLLQTWVKIRGPGTVDDDRLDTMYVEELGRVSVKGVPYSTRWDRIKWFDSFQGPGIQEHKTTSRYSEVLLAGYRIDPQILGQIFCWQKSHMFKRHGPLKVYEVDICVKTANPTFPVEQVPIVWDAVKDWFKAKQHEWLHMQQCKLSGKWPRRRSSCVQYGRMCDLYEHCVSLNGPSAGQGWEKKEKGDF